MRLLLLLLAPLLAAPAPGQPPDPPPSRIVVTGMASASTPPDRATIRYVVHGEGATSDEAVAALAAARRAIEGALGRYGDGARIGAERIAIAEVRGRDCHRDDDDRPSLSTGACAIVGYTADVGTSLTTAQVLDAGTIVGLIARQGGREVHLERFFLSDDGPARARAMVAALADARKVAEAIASGSGAPLGRLLSATDASQRGNVGDIVVTAMRRVPEGAAQALAPPIPVVLTPRPILTDARVTVAYAIGR